MDSASLIAQDRAEGYRPGVGIVLLHRSQILLGLQGGGLSMITHTPEGDWVIEDPPRYKLDWEIPQGGIEEGETVEEAFHRELREELGSWWMYGISKPRLFRHERMRFPVEKDGKRYIGKSYLFCWADALLVSCAFFDTVRPDADGGRGLYPTPAFRGGVDFLNHQDAEEVIAHNTPGRKTTLVSSVLRDLVGQGLLITEGGKMEGRDFEYCRALPPTDPLHLAA